jgi:hypothetical protein
MSDTNPNPAEPRPPRDMSDEPHVDGGSESASDDSARTEPAQGSIPLPPMARAYAARAGTGQTTQGSDTEDLDTRPNKTLSDDNTTAQETSSSAVSEPATAVYQQQAGGEEKPSGGSEPEVPAANPYGGGAHSDSGTWSASPMYVQPPKPPRMRGNRGFGLLIAVISIFVFAIVYAVIVAILGMSLSSDNSGFIHLYIQYISTPSFWMPLAAFAVGMVLLVLIINRGRWWGFVLGGFFVGVLAYAGFIGGALTQTIVQLGGPGNLTADEAWGFVSSLWLNPFALAAGFIGREVPIWFGAWIAWRGRKVTAENIRRCGNYERELDNISTTEPAPTA